MAKYTTIDGVTQNEANAYLDDVRETLWTFMLEGLKYSNDEKVTLSRVTMIDILEAAIKNTKKNE